jgi:predicted nucleic acid binding AN1-type Zn finger protein
MDTNDVSGNAQKKVPRCRECRKRLLLTDSVCKCNIVFCSKHRAAEMHNCTFDYRAESTKYLSTNLVKLTSVKIESL